MSLNDGLVMGWRKCDLDSPPYLFPDDKSYVLESSGVSNYRTFDEFTSSAEFGSSTDTTLHIGLLPSPFVGNLEKATIFVLMLNPGLSPGDYFAEEHEEEFRIAHIRTLRQRNDGDEYPFIFLNPQFSWHPGFGWWQKKFHNIIHQLSKQSGITYQRAMSEVAKSLACLELLPYHSRSFGVGALLNRLPSVKAMRDFVQEVVLPKVMGDQAIIIATRGVRNWQLPNHTNIIAYEGGETRSAHLSLASRGGKAIAKHLGLSGQ